MDQVHLEMFFNLLKAIISEHGKRMIPICLLIENWKVKEVKRTQDFIKKQITYFGKKELICDAHANVDMKQDKANESH